MNINSVVICGRLVDAPETRTVGEDNQVANFTLALNRVFYVKEEKREEVSFVKVEAWGNNAKIVSEYCQKGSEVAVEGYLVQNKWTDKESGQNRSELRVKADRIALGAKPSNGEAKGDSPKGKTWVKKESVEKDAEKVGTPVKRAF